MLNACVVHCLSCWLHFDKPPSSVVRFQPAKNKPHFGKRILMPLKRIYRRLTEPHFFVQPFDCLLFLTTCEASVSAGKMPLRLFEEHKQFLRIIPYVMSAQLYLHFPFLFHVSAPLAAIHLLEADFLLFKFLCGRE